MTAEVTVLEDNYTVEIEDGSGTTVEVTELPAPTVEISEDGSTVELTASPTTTTITPQAVNTVEVAEPDRVIVHTAGIGGGLNGFYSQAEILTLLGDALTLDQFIPGIQDDLTMLADFWLRVGNQVDVLWTGDAIDMETSWKLYTDNQIASAVASVTVDTDGKLSLQSTLINQTSARIDLQAIDLQTFEDDLLLKQASINLNASNIALSVIDINTLTGDMSSAQFDISANEAAISVESSRIDTATGDIITNAGGIVANSDSISSYVIELNTATGNISSLTTELTAVAATTTATQSSLTGTQAEVESVQTQMADFWGVTITEDINGLPYISSMGLVLHTDWVLGDTYLGDDTEGAGNGDYVAIPDGTIYRCIVGHTPATAANAPTGVDGPTYWVLDATGKKSTFRVDAELFEIYDATDVGNEQKPLFQVSAGEVTLGYDVDLKSDGYDTGSPGYSLSPSAGTANFRDMRMTFSSGTDAQQNVRDDLNTAQTFRSTPTTPYAVGDIWDRGPSIGIYVCDTAKTAAQSYSSGDWSAAADWTSSNTAAAITGQGDLATLDSVTWGGATISGQPVDADLLNANQLWAELDGGTYFDITSSGLLLKDTASNIVMGKTGADGGTIISRDKTSFGHSTPEVAGFFIGWDVAEGAYCFDFGDNTDYIRWDGSDLILSDNAVLRGNILGGSVSSTKYDYDASNQALSGTTTQIASIQYDHTDGVDDDINVFVFCGFNPVGTATSSTTLDWYLYHQVGTSCSGAEYERTGYQQVGLQVLSAQAGAYAFNTGSLVHCGLSDEKIRFNLDALGTNWTGSFYASDAYIIAFGLYK